MAAQVEASPSCRKVPQCYEAVTRAESLISHRELKTALAELQGAYARTPDPRLLVSIGNLLHQQGQAMLARESCQRAQVEAPTDTVLQHQANACVTAASAALAQVAMHTPTSAASRTDAKNNSSQAPSTIHNSINVAPKINMTPTITVSPQIQLVQPLSAESARTTSTSGQAGSEQGLLTTSKFHQAATYKRPWFISLMGIAAALATSGAIAWGILGTRGPELPDNVVIKSWSLGSVR